MKYIKLFENFISNNDFLVESDWEKYIPNEISIKKDGKNGKYILRDSLKNFNDINLIYNLDSSDSETMPNTLTVTISFKMKNDSENPMVNNSFECIIEIMVGTLYIIGTKVSKDGVSDFIPKKADIDNKASSKLANIIKYVSGNVLKINSIK